VLSDAARREVHHLAERLGQTFLVNLAGALAIDIDGKRLRYTDRIGNLDQAVFGEARRDDVLGEMR
jgi:hypothetical protein